VDHRPTTERELVLDSASEHVLNAAAPGRITRRFSFAVRPGLRLKVYLGRSLPLPSPTDPPPLPSELLADSPEQAREIHDIEAAFAKLDRYAECLALVGDASPSGKKTGVRGRMRTEEHGLCERLAGEAAAARPAMPELESASEAYLTAVRGGQRLEQLARLGATFRAEFLAARTSWQFEELAWEEKQGGAKSGWQMRRIALAAQSWLRALKAGQGASQAATKLREYQGAFVDSANQAGADLAVSGQADFARASEELVALAGEGKKPSDMAALDGCRRLLSAFNALILP